MVSDMFACNFKDYRVSKPVVRLAHKYGLGEKNVRCL